MDNFLSSQREQIFCDVELLIYVFDVESRDIDRDMHYYQACLDAMMANSKDAKIFVLIHKMDLIQREHRDEACWSLSAWFMPGFNLMHALLLQVFNKKIAELKAISEPLQIVGFATSIWDETLYRAWSVIVYSLIPNISVLESALQEFCRLCRADEVVLFERTTFLVISAAQTKQHLDIHRFEKISNIVKQFKLSCRLVHATEQNVTILLRQTFRLTNN